MEQPADGLINQHNDNQVDDNLDRIERAEDRELFKELCQGLGEPVLPSEIAETLEEDRKSTRLNSSH